jgi:membrane protein implicated in regulation of membrane protease activity
MVDYIANHLPQFWLVLGFVLLVIEVIIGFTSGILLFAGLGALTSGALMNFGIVPETWIAGVATTGISAGIITGLLWKPMKKFQGDKPIEKDNSSDLVGYQFVVNSNITETEPGFTQYSGIQWRVEIDKRAGVSRIEAGQRVSVSSVEVGLFRVILI